MKSKTSTSGIKNKYYEKKTKKLNKRQRSLLKKKLKKQNKGKSKNNSLDKGKEIPCNKKEVLPCNREKTSTIKSKDNLADNDGSATESKKQKKELVKNEQVHNNIKPVYKINSPDDFSANWRNVKEIITSNDRKRPLELKEEINNQSNSKDEKNSDDEIWFDDIDPMLIEENEKQLKLPVRTLEKITEAESITSRLVKNNSFYEPTKVLGLDCEMVGGGFKGERDLLGRVSVVNTFGHAIYDKFVKPNEPIKDYRTEFSGIRPKDLINAEPFEKVQKEVSDLLKDRVIVGHALHHDFKCLMLSHPKHRIRDTSKYKPFRKFCGGSKPSLKKLADKILGIQIQAGEHCSVQDSQAAMRLYTLNRREWEKAIQMYKRKQKAKSNSSKTSS